VFAEIDCLEDNICAAIRVLVMAGRRHEGVLTLKRVLEPERGRKRGRDSLAGHLKKLCECV